jgi:pimeloyl-ACP methyl ester carboxylesterase
MWDDVVRRLATHGLRARAVELWDPVPAEPTVSGLAERLAGEIRSMDDEVVLVAHGTAVPVARAAAAREPVAGMVLTNGPLTALDPATRTLASLARSPRALASTLLQPAAWNRWLASSAGMRRTVVNPYVMDRDTVVALTAPYTRTAEHRSAAARFLRDLRELPTTGAPQSPRNLVVWGDEDPLYPAALTDEARTLIPGVEVAEVPGGQHFHPVERPWYIADVVAEWWAGERSTEGAAG